MPFLILLSSLPQQASLRSCSITQHLRQWPGGQREQGLAGKLQEGVYVAGKHMLREGTEVGGAAREF